MVSIDQTHTVRKGDCAWKLAKQNLKARNQTVSNSAIINEMKRLAQLNNCNSVEDFNNKFFNRPGNEILIDDTSKQTNSSINNNSTSRKPSTATRDSVAADTTSQRNDNILKQNTDTIVKDNTRVESGLVKVDNTNIQQHKIRTPKDTKEAEIKRINNLTDDKSRIIEYNKTNYDGKYYGIVDKKTCKLNIYDKQGNVVKSFTVGVGKSIGDGISSYYMEHNEKTKDAWKAESQRFTTAGEFTLDEHKKTIDAYTGKDGKPKVMHLKGDNKGVRSGQLGLHMLYKPQYDKRKAAIDSPGLEDNRMSYGCVNLKEEDYDVMHQYLGEGNKIYVLPEEQGNKLQLEKQKDGSYKFEQIYHKNDARGLSKEEASKVNYDIHPERDPKYIAKQKAKKAAQEKQLAQQKATEQPKYEWYDPRGWFS